MLGWRGLCDFVCITQAKLQSTSYCPFIRETAKWPKEVFFYLLQCCLFNSYVIFSKNNPNSRKSFLDFMSDITEKYDISDAVSSPSSSDESHGSSRSGSGSQVFLCGQFIYIYIYIYTGCPRRNVPDFGRVFLRSNYTDITQNTYTQSCGGVLGRRNMCESFGVLLWLIVFGCGLWGFGRVGGLVRLHTCVVE